MTLSPKLCSLINEASGRYLPTRGIIPFSPYVFHPRDLLISDVGDMISDAVTGPGIHAYELAEMIIDEVEEHFA